MNLPTAAPSIRAMADLATPMSIRVAATLSLVERAGSAGATAERLAAETGTAAPAIRRLLDHLVTIGVFDLDTESSRTRLRRTARDMLHDSGPVAEGRTALEFGVAPHMVDEPGITATWRSRPA